MKIRKGIEMKARFDKTINDERLEIISDEIRLLLVEINSARNGKSILGLEVIENQLKEIEEFIDISK